jgi:hypothetical protein
LREARLPSLEQADVSVVPYEGDERLELVREALLTLAKTMYVSRQTVLDLATDSEASPEVRFGDPEFEDEIVIELRGETYRCKEVWELVHGLLSDDRLDSEVGSDA